MASSSRSTPSMRSLIWEDPKTLRSLSRSAPRPRSFLTSMVGQSSLSAHSRPGQRNIRTERQPREAGSCRGGNELGTEG